MSRAMLVLDTEGQRRRATDWVWAAKNGSRVEFKGPKRTLDQNSLMWALLTDVAVHMRKAAGLQYSTEEWKHIFLHGWGREVRFLPALDGKGVVPIPQSSSDLSKEEMTDFIEFILKEGAERGVTFHNPQEQPSTETAAAGLAEGDEEPPASEPSAVNERDMVNSARPMLTDGIKAEMVRKLLQLAGDGKLTVQERLENLDGIKPAWAERITGHPGLVDQCFATAARIIRKEIPADAARKYMEALL